MILTAAQHVFGFLRTIVNLPRDGTARDFLDLSETGALDEEAHDVYGERRRFAWLAAEGVDGEAADPFDRIAEGAAQGLDAAVVAEVVHQAGAVLSDSPIGMRETLHERVEGGGASLEKNLCGGVGPGELFARQQLHELW